MPLSARETKKLKVARIRDSALTLMREKGSWTDTSGIKVLTADHGPLQLVYRTPFQRLPPVDAATRYMMALGGKKNSLAYGLDIWHHHKKVLNIEWDENDSDFTLTTYKRGDWEFALTSE